jgi:ADP-heptose:LPS heptosyltransferase
MTTKQLLQKFLPARVYSFLIRFNKMAFTVYATSGIKTDKSHDPKKKILIVKPDAIGDYIMFRNCIEEIKKSKKYKGYKIYLLGNNLWKNISDNIDRKNLEKSYFIDHKKLYNKNYLRELVEKLNKENFELIAHPVFHRQFIVDGMIKKIKAKEKIGYSGKSFHQGSLETKVSDRAYTKLISTTQNLEFDKCRDFFSKIINEEISLKNPKINIKRKQKNYIIVNPGSSVEFRRWKPGNFAKTIDHLIEKYRSKVYIIGSKSELELGIKVRDLSKNKSKIEIYNGKSLMEVLNLIAGSRGVVSNDTSTTHMAVALGKKVYCITCGVGYKTAYPYPNYKNAIYFYPPSFNRKMWGENVSDINETTSEMVIKKIKF